MLPSNKRGSGRVVSSLIGLIWCPRSGLRTGRLLAAGRMRTLLRGDPRFPQQLLDLPRPPHWLFVQGAMSPLKGPAVTIVGTREPSADGNFMVLYVATCL